MTALNGNGRQQRSSLPRGPPALVEKQNGNVLKKARETMYSNWNTLLARIVCTKMYRYQIFIREEDLTSEGTIFKVAMKEIGIDEESISQAKI